MRLGNEEEQVLHTHEVGLFIGPKYVVTHRSGATPSIDRVRHMAGRDERILNRGPAFLLYPLTDELVTDVMPVVTGLDDRIDLVENVIFGRPSSELIETIFDRKRGLMQLRRLVPQRAVLFRLARGDSSVMPQEDRVFFRDVYDHLVRQYDMVEGLRDLIAGALDTYLSVVSNRLNDVMKTLTIITTLFMPLSFLTGFFGMNFFQPMAASPLWTSNGIFMVTLAIMIGLPLGMSIWMRRRRWM